MTANIRSITLSEIQLHEQLMDANVRLGTYEMNVSSPTSEIECFHLELTGNDVGRLFLLWERTFIPHTHNRTCKLADVTSSAKSMVMPRRPAREQQLVDLAVETGTEPVLITSDLHVGPLVTIDGNHR